MVAWHVWTVTPSHCITKICVQTEADRGASRPFSVKRTLFTIDLMAMEISPPFDPTGPGTPRD